MQISNNFQKLRTERRRLVIVYVGFVLAFSSSCAMAASGVKHNAVLGAFALSALIALPLYAINLLVHFTVKAIRPAANSTGIKQLVTSLVLFTPIEAALILPAINIVVSSRLLGEHTSQNTQPDDSLKPKPQRGPP